MIVALALVGCSSGQPQRASDVSSPIDSPGATAASPDPTTPAPSAKKSPDRGPAFSVEKQQDDGFPDLNSDALPRAVRLAEQDGYTRIVLDLGGTGTPHYSAEYVDTPAADGSGEPIAVGGEAFLQVRLSGVRIPEEGEALAPRLSDGVGDIEQVYVGGPFEGMAQVVVGVASASAFRVFTLEAPSRLVIDVREG